jgi:hypothetical protein
MRAALSRPRQGGRSRPFAIVACAALAACAAGAAGPIYTLSSNPASLHYAIHGSGTQTISTPMGPQETSSEERAVVTIDYAGPRGEGTAFRAAFDSVSVSLSSQQGTMRPDLGAVVGATFEGVADPGGGMTDVKMPELELGAYGTANLLQLMSDLVPPLPPGGEPGSEGWPWSVSLPSGGGLDGTLVVEGTARMVGDSAWNGMRLRVIESEGTVTLAASGTPATAPAPITVDMEGTATGRWLWDQTRGALVAASVRSETSGSVAIPSMAMDLPIEAQSTREIELIR